MSGPLDDRVRSRWVPVRERRWDRNRVGFSLQLGPLHLRWGFEREPVLNLPRPDPVFVVGMPRSGTSLLAAMLASHPHFIGLPETHFFKDLDANTIDRITRDPWWPEAAVRYCALLSNAGRPILPFLGLLPGTLSRRLERQPHTIESVFQSLRPETFTGAGGLRQVEQTPGHYRHAASIRAALPNATVLCIIRDPRDVAVSIRGTSWGSHRTPEQCYQSWVDMVRRLEAQPGVSWLRYEDLVADPPRVLASLAHALGEGWHPSMLSYQVAATAMTMPAEQGWKANLQRPIIRGAAYRWRTRMPVAERRTCLRICRPYLSRYGYDA